MKKTIFISAGSSGGHIYPAISLAKQLIQKGHVVYFVASLSRMEGKILPEHGFDILNVTSPTLRKPFKGFNRFLSELITSIKESMRYATKHSPDMIISFGGAVTFSIGLVAFLKRIPLYLHEQNAVFGLANQSISLFAKKIFTQFELKSFFLQHKMIHVGSPRTSEFRNYHVNHDVFKNLGFDASKPLVVFVMGSLGSLTMQTMLVDMVQKYPTCDYQRLIVTGSRFYDEVRHFQNIKGTVFVESISLIDLYPYITLLISRSGATTMAEILGSQTPSILIPSPYVTRQHQLLNALIFQRANAALLLHEFDLNPDKLFMAIHECIRDESQRETMKHVLSTMTTYNEIDLMLEHCGL